MGISQVWDLCLMISLLGWISNVQSYFTDSLIVVNHLKKFFVCFRQLQSVHTFFIFMHGVSHQAIGKDTSAPSKLNKSTNHRI